MRRSTVEALERALAAALICAAVAFLLAGCAHIPTRVEMEMVACEVRCSPALPLFYMPATSTTPPICICQGVPWKAPGDAESEPERPRAPGLAPGETQEARR